MKRNELKYSYCNGMQSNYSEGIKILPGGLSLKPKKPYYSYKCEHVGSRAPKSRCTSTGFVAAKQEVPYVLRLNSTPQIKMIKLIYKPAYRRGCRR